MAEALGVAASIISVIQLTGTVITLCWNYRNGVRGAAKEAAALTRELKILGYQLESLLSSVENEDRLHSVESLASPGGAIEDVRNELEGLSRKLDPKGVKGALTWPFREKDINQTMIRLERFKSLFQLAMSGDTITATLRVEDLALEEAMARKKKEIILWLAAPDPSENLNAALSIREPTTCQWLLTHQEYTNWSAGEVLWLNGIPGAGKTVLTATVIEAQKPQCVYYFFSFSDRQKRDVLGMLRSLVSQLIALQPLSDETYAWYEQSQLSKATFDSLEKILKKLLDDRAIVIDALDECTELSTLLKLILRLQVKIFVSSRRELEIEKAFAQVHRSVSAGKKSITSDIKRFVASRLESDPRLSQWPLDIHKEIKTGLVSRAAGMFRMAACQLDELSKCRKMKILRETLQKLPASLDEMYSRILCNIPEEYRKDVRKAFIWIMYTEKPLSIDLLARAAVIDENGSVDDCFPDPRWLQELCSSLVAPQKRDRKPMVIREIPPRPEMKESSSIETLIFAHFSVQEYLTSHRIKEGPASFFSIDKSAQTELTIDCLNYMQSPSFLDDIQMKGFTLGDYAHLHWFHHARETYLYKPILRFLNSPVFFIIHNPRSPNSQFIADRLGVSACCPLCFAARYRLMHVLSKILSSDDSKKDHINHALFAACTAGDEEAILLLLHHGADVNAVNRKSKQTPLDHSILMGKLDLSLLLLRNGARLDLPRKQYLNMLQHTAMTEGLHGIVMLLLRRGVLEEEPLDYATMSLTQLQTLEWRGKELKIPYYVKKKRSFSDSVQWDLLNDFYFGNFHKAKDERTPVWQSYLDSFQSNGL